MKMLHIMRSEPDKVVQILVRGISKDKANQAVLLYEGNVDYERLIEDIFASDRVVVWW